MRGHVYHFTEFVADDPVKAGSLIDKFVVVLQNETEFPADRLRIVVAVATSNQEGSWHGYNVLARAGALGAWRHDTVIQCADLRSILKADLKDPAKAEYCGILGDDVIERIDLALLVSLGMGATDS